MSFEKCSYFSIEANTNKENFKQNKEKFYFELFDLNQDLNSILRSFKHTDYENKDYTLIGLFCRIIQNYNAITILSQYGFDSEIKVLLRSMLETSFNFSAIIYDESFFETYMQKADSENLRFIKSIKKNPKEFSEEIHNSVSEDYIEELKGSVQDMAHVNTYGLAEKARMTNLYLYTYNSLSLEVHGGAKSIMDYYFDLDKKKNVIGLKFGQNYESFEYVFVTILYVVAHILDAASIYFIDDYSDTIEKTKKIIAKFDSKL